MPADAPPKERGGTKAARRPTPAQDSLGARHPAVQPPKARRRRGTPEDTPPEDRAFTESPGQQSAPEARDGTRRPRRARVGSQRRQNAPPFARRTGHETAQDARRRRALAGEVGGAFLRLSATTGTRRRKTPADVHPQRDPGTEAARRPTPPRAGKARDVPPCRHPTTRRESETSADFLRGR
jgi:hypothetical protein